jgi:hypothetical protein
VELKYYILLSKDLGYLKMHDKLANQVKEAARKLQAMINRINAKKKLKRSSDYPDYWLPATGCCFWSRRGRLRIWRE